MSGKVFVVSFMRLNSQRLPNKLLENICGSSLVEIMTLKLLRLRKQMSPEIEVALALHPQDQLLMDVAQRFSCPVLQRTNVSRDGETHQDIYGDLRERVAERGHERLVVVNPCFPFLRTRTIADYVFGETDASAVQSPRVAVLRHRGWVWNQEFEMIHGGATPNTKRDPEFYTLTHAMFSYPTGLLGTPDQMKFRHFVPYDSSPEFIDIDTEDDLRFARTFALGLSQSQGSIDWTN